jgi:Cdc6-like AAA superfamily ATPase
MNWTDLNLTQNPFANRTPTKNKDMLWAGMKDIKEKILKIYRQAFTGNQKQLVLNWGPIGGGKTHSAYYFLNNRLENISDEQISCIYIKLPKDGADADTDIINYIFDGLSSKKIKDTISKSIQEKGKEVFLEFLSQRISSEDVANSIYKLCQSVYPSEILSKYIFNTLDKSELKSLNLTRPIKTMMDKVKFLAGLIIAYTSTEPEKRIFIWIDEAEDLVYYNAKQSKIFSQLIRDLTDEINEKITLFINFTFTEPDLDTIKYYLGDFLWSRLTDKVEFKRMNYTNAFEYSKDAIMFYQIDKNVPLFPFDEAMIQMLLKTISNDQFTPREINELFNDFLLFVMNNNLSMITQQTILDFQNNQK